MLSLLVLLSVCHRNARHADATVEPLFSQPGAAPYPPMGAETTFTETTRAETTFRRSLFDVAFVYAGVSLTHFDLARVDFYLNYGSGLGFVDRDRYGVPKPPPPSSMIRSGGFPRAGGAGAGSGGVLTSRTAHGVQIYPINGTARTLNEWSKYWQGNQGKLSQYVVALKTAFRRAFAGLHSITEAREVVWEERPIVPTALHKRGTSDSTDDDPGHLCEDTSSPNSPGKPWRNKAGKTCADYKREQWCLAGDLEEEWAGGGDWQFPELYCCVCGEGSTISSSSTTPQQRHHAEWWKTGPTALRFKAFFSDMTRLRSNGSVRTKLRNEVGSTPRFLMVRLLRDFFSVLLFSFNVDRIWGPFYELWTQRRGRGGEDAQQDRGAKTFKARKPVAFWRGASTGMHARFVLVDRWGGFGDQRNGVDVGFSWIVQTPERTSYNETGGAKANETRTYKTRANPYDRNKAPYRIWSKPAAGRDEFARHRYSTACSC